MQTTKPPNSGPPQIDLNLRLFCRDCRDQVPNIVEDFAAGDLICGNCGLVLGNRIIDTRSEWRTFANSGMAIAFKTYSINWIAITFTSTNLTQLIFLDDNSGDPSRVGSMGDPLLGGNNILETTIISGVDNNTGLSRDLNRALNKINQDKSTINLVEAFKSIDSMCTSISLPRIIVDTAKQLFKQVEDEKMIKGKSGEAVKASCIYIACGMHHSARTFKEICNLTKVSKKEIGKYYKLLQPKLKEPTSNLSLDAYVFRFSSQLDLSSRIQQAAVKV